MFYSSQNRIRPFLAAASSAAGAAVASATRLSRGFLGNDPLFADHCFGYIAKAAFNRDQIAAFQIGNDMDSGIGIQPFAFSLQVEVVVPFSMRATRNSARIWMSISLRTLVRI